MKMINRIALSNAKYHKSKNILTGIAIFLTTLLLFLVPTIGLDFISVQKAVINELYPNWHALFRNVSADTVTKLASHHLVQQYGLRCDLGKISGTSAANSLIYMDENAFDLYNISLDEGTIPQAENEIVVSRKFLNRLSRDTGAKDLDLSHAGIGDKITLSYQVAREGGLDFAKEKEFVICGFLTDTSNDDEETIFTSFISASLLEEELPANQIRYRFLFRINDDSSKNTDEIEKDIKHLSEQFSIGEDAVKINTDLLWANYVDPSFLPILVIIVLVIVFAGIITIYSIYYISIGERVQELGKLKAIGATSHQLKKIILTEGMLAAAIAIPAGLLIGTLLTKAVFLVMLNTYSNANAMIEATKEIISEGRISLIVPWLYGLAAAVALLTVFLSLLHPMKIVAGISEIEAIRYQDNTLKKGKKTRTGYLNLSIGKLTRIQLSGNKKRSLITICSMSVTGLFFMVVATVLSCTDPKEAANNNILGEYEIIADIEFGNKERPDLEWREVQKNNPLTEELKEKILNIEGITSVECISGNFAYSDVFDGNYEEIIGIPENLKDKLEDGLVEGTVSYDELKSGDKVIADKNIFYWYPNIKLGDTIDVTIDNGDEMISHKLKIAAIGDYDLGLTNYNHLIMAEEGIKQFSNYSCNKYFYIFAKEKYDEEAEAQLKALVTESGNMELATWKEYYDEWASGISVTKIACYTFLGVLGAICIMNMINTMISSVHSRKKEFGMLQAIGMSDRQLLSMLHLESAFYTIGSLVVAIAGGSIAAYPIFLWAKDNGFFNIRSFHYPLEAICIMVLVLAIVQVATTFAISKSIRKDTLIDRIRFNN